MDIASRYEIEAPDVVAEAFDGEMVILNLANGHYYSLRGIAAPLWSLLLAGHTPGAILDSVRMARPELAGPATDFLGEIVALKLVRPRTGNGIAEVPEPIAETWSGEAPRMEVFDDLAELIYADPIHDVDEQAGWPTPRTAR